MAAPRPSAAGPSRAVKRNPAARPGSVTPGAGPAVRILPNSAAAGSGDWSGRSSVTSAAWRGADGEGHPVGVRVDDGGDRHGVPDPRRPGQGAGLSRRERLAGLHAHVRPRAERGLILDGARPALPLRQRQRPGGHGQHDQQRRAALPDRQAAYLPAGHGRGQPPAAGRQQVACLAPGRKQPEREDGAAGQRQRRRDHDHRVHAEVPGRARRHRRVVAQLPARHHGQQHQRQVGAGPGDAGDGASACPGAPAPCPGSRC